MAHVCFVYQALFFLTESGEKPCAEHHESNSNFNRTVRGGWEVFQCNGTCISRAFYQSHHTALDLSREIVCFT